MDVKQEEGYSALGSGPGDYGGGPGPGIRRSQWRWQIYDRDGGVGFALKFIIIILDFLFGILLTIFFFALFSLYWWAAHARDGATPEWDAWELFMG
jgi:hypothetical protein